MIILEKPKVVTIHEKKHHNIDLTSMRLFLQLLNHARALKNDLNMGRAARGLYLRGMKAVMVLNSEDFRIADARRDYFRHLNSHAYMNNGENNNW